MRLLYFLAVLSYVYANPSIETMKASLIELLTSTRSRFKSPSGKLAPFEYSKDVEDLAVEWANTCHRSMPSDPRFANMQGYAGKCPIYWPLVREWTTRLLAEEKAYDPATGKCSTSSCKHYMQVTQPNNTKFGCAIKVCHVKNPNPKSFLLSVCLYRADKQSIPIHQTAGSVTTTNTSRTATTATSTTTTATPTTTTTTTTTTTRRPNTTTTTATTPNATTSITSTTTEGSTTGTVKLSVSSELPPTDKGTEMEEAEEEEDIEEEDEGVEDGDDKAAKTSDSPNLSSHLLPLAMIAITVLV
ncbi:Allergen V5 Tpx 1 [Echinococcus multilocularis]|uniref:Allergen V5 Tpx 1 n=1 Tax=Echinococcus multilocularis TaxID=6211 RepID=A0A068YFW6_ECHMU|nr:Allergen V5 Tpx 1 [Echinococcus multilocularis]